MSVLGELGSLVGWERGRISPAIYFDPEVYRREQARVFEGSWVPVGHEDMVRNPGDYVANYVGEVPVIVGPGPGRGDPGADQQVPAPGESGVPV